MTNVARLQKTASHGADPLPPQAHLNDPDVSHLGQPTGPPPLKLAGAARRLGAR